MKKEKLMITKTYYKDEKKSFQKELMKMMCDNNFTTEKMNNKMYMFINKDKIVILKFLNVSRETS